MLKRASFSSVLFLGLAAVPAAAAPPPKMNIGDVTVVEGNSGTVSAAFAVTLSKTTSKTVTVHYATANGTATAPGDYTTATGNLTFTPGQTSKTIAILVNGDTLYEANETFTVTLTLARNAQLQKAIGTGTITNDDAPPTMSIGDSTVAEGNAGTANAVFTLTLSAASGVSATASYATADGTATAGTDYVAVAGGAVSFAPGVTTQTIAVAVNGDVDVEADETFFVDLSAPAGATLADPQGIGNILNDDFPPISITDATVTEGDSGTVPAVFTVSLGVPSVQTVYVDYATADGTARSASDYGAVSGTLSFDPGVTAQTIAVVVSGDALNEADETFFVDLTNPVKGILADPQGLGTLTNDDPLPTLAVDDVTVSEGDVGTTFATFTVSLSTASGQVLTADYATNDGTAAAGSDYAGASGTLTFPEGVASRAVVVTVAGDLVDEADETFTLDLTGYGAVTDGQGLGTIVNDDTLPSLTIDDVRVTEGSGPPTPAVFSVTLSAASGLDVTVDYATANGTARAGGDYAAASGSLSFAPGETTQTLAVSVVADTVHERNETFLVTLSNASNAKIVRGRGQGAIADDDGLADPCTNPIATAPITIAAPGRYCLASDVATSTLTGAAITIATDDVILDLAGHTLAGTAGTGTEAFGIYANGQKNIDIRRGTVAGFLAGIDIAQAPPYTTPQGIVVSGIAATGNSYAGIWAEGLGNTIADNKVEHTGGTTVFGAGPDVFGIVTAGPSATIRGNYAYETLGVGGGAGYGITVTLGDGSAVARNHVANLTPGASTGIHLCAQSVMALIADARARPFFVKDRKSTRLNSSHSRASRMPSSA